MNVWAPSSWRSLPCEQQPRYPDEGALQATSAQLAELPPLVTSWEIEALKKQLALASEGKAFLLQGGDCAERFDECRSSEIAAKLKILLQMSLILVHATKRPVIRVGRFAGQYVKPRSADTETRDGVTLPSYRGDLVNRAEFEERARTPDPELMLRGYERAALTINFIRSLIDGGFADLHHPEYWNLEFVRHSPHASEYHAIVDRIGHSIEFMETISGVSISQLNRVDFFTSHEGLHLPYEEAQTREVPRREGWYNLSTHFPWIGQRTAVLGQAHVEYFRGIRNPIGMKVGCAMAPEQLGQLIDVLDPEGEPGRLTLIHRFGAHQIAEALPPLIEVVLRERALGRVVL